MQASIFTRWVKQVSANLISISLFFFVIFVVNRSFYVEHRCKAAMARRAEARDGWSNPSVRHRIAGAILVRRVKDRDARNKIARREYIKVN